MIIYLRDISKGMIAGWNEFFEGVPDVHISEGHIFDDGPHMTAEAIVSPANSFGFMDGGIDYVYSDFFGWSMQDHLQRKIHEEYDGELLVGQAAIIDIHETNPDSPIKYLISAPTMRTPGVVASTVNAFLAFRAALKAAKAQGINSILCPGLATAIGKMPYRQCAAQMLEAHWLVSKGGKLSYSDLGNAHMDHHTMLWADIYKAKKFAHH